MCHYFFLFLSSGTVPRVAGILRVNCVAGVRLTHPPLKHQRTATLELQAHFAIALRALDPVIIAYRRHQHYYPPRPRYNNTTKLFKGTARITRGKYKSMCMDQHDSKASELCNIEPTLHVFFQWSRPALFSLSVGK